MKKLQCLLVEWDDAWSNSGWHSSSTLEKEHKAILVKSVGFVYKKNKQGVTLVGGYDDELGTPLSPHFIPRKMIRKTKKIKY